MVIPMIAFLEGGMRIPMGIVTRDYLRAHRFRDDNFCLIRGYLVQPDPNGPGKTRLD